MANFLNYIVESSIQPVKTNVLWIKNGVPYYFNKKWKPLLGSGSGGGSGESVDFPIQFGEGEYSAVLKNSNSKALNDYALALGYNTVSNNPSETAFGRYNKSIQSNVLSEATLFSIGNGSKDKFNNALEVKYDGSLFLQNLDKSVQENLKVLLENQISFDIDLKEIGASISATEEKLRSEYTQIKEDLEGNISDLNSSITQTAEEIRLEVNEIQTNLDGKIEENTSLIQQTAEQIRLEVSEEVKTLDGKIEENTSSITQTANEIRLEVESVTTNLDSKIEKNTSAITQTAEEIRSEVSASIETLDGKINENSTSISQTAESITILASKTEELENKNVEYDSKFVQTAEQIEAVVGRVETTEESIKNVNSSITQTAEAIRSEVAKEVETLSGEIEKNTTSIIQNANSINLRVEGLEDTLNSKTSELEGKITKNTSEIALNKEQIGLKVNIDVFDALAGTVEQQGASIEINTNSIKNKVEQANFNAFTGEVNNQFTEVNQSIEGITTTVQDNIGKITVIEETVDGLTSKTGTLEAEIESLKKQSDGSIDTHFGTTAPTLNNEPAVNWDTDELKNEHTGDIYYNNNTGEAYRFSYDPQTNTYFWVELTDSALTDALEKISKLEEAIDGKVTIFYTQPSNYKYGDIWFVHNNSYSPYKEGSLLTATNLAKDAVVESFNINHWVLKADIVKSLNDLDKTVTDAFKDNIITIAEVDAIKESKKAFEASFQELTSAHTIIIATTLGNSTKLKTAYSNLESKYNAFIQSIDSLVLDSNGNLSDVLLQAYKTAYNDYIEALKNYSKAKEELTDSIQRELSSANDYIKDISSDGVITPIEKKNLIEIWRSIAEEFNTNKGIAVNYKIIDSEGNERTDIYSDGVYYSNYALYEAAFDEIKTIFTSDVFGISNTTTSTTLPEEYSTNTIDDALNNYYDTLSVFAEMISKITIEITDAHEKVLQLSKELQEQLSPSDNITQIGKGVILSSIIGVQSNGVLQAGLNATNITGLVDTSKDNHGRIVFAGGINGATDWNTANTVIYEDGYVHFKWGEIDEGVEIGNALIRSVVSGTIDLFSYPENGTLVPLFIVNKDNTGKIVSISTPYDFIANKNLIVHGDTSSGGEGDPSTVVGATSVVVDGTTYPARNGVIDMTAAFENLQEEIDLTNYYTRPEVNQQINNAITGLNIGQYLKSNTAESTYAKITSLTAVDNRLKGIEAYFATSEDAGTQIDKWNEIVAFLNATEGTTLAGILEAYTLKSVYEAFVSSTNTALADRYTKAQTNSAISTALASYYTKNEIDGKVTTINNALADRYTKAQVDGIVTTINQSISSVDNKYAPTKTWADTLASLIVNENGNVRIKTNLIVNGDTASGGGSGESAIGITGILLNGTTYRDENGDGVIDLGTITSGLTSVNWSDVNGRPTSLSQFNNDLGLGTLAYKNGLTASEVGALSTSGGTISGGLTIQASSPAVTFKKSNASNPFASLGIYSDKLAMYVNSEAKYYDIYHAGNFNPANYLPLTGGKIEGPTGTYTPLFVKTTDPESWIGFTDNVGTYYIGTYRGVPSVYKSGVGTHTLLHSGNYSDYALPLRGGKVVGGSALESFGIKTTHSSGLPALGFYNGDTRIGVLRYMGDRTLYIYDGDFNQPLTLLHSGNIGDYSAQLLVADAHADGNQALLKNAISLWNTAAVNFKEDYGLSLSISNKPSATSGSRWRSRLDFGTSGKIYYWSAVNSDTMTYRGELAFTDSNVAAAQALKHSNGTIGATAYSDGKVYTDYGFLLKNNSAGIYSFDKDGGYRKILFFGSDNNMYFGFNTSSDPMRIYGSPIRFIANGADAMLINSSGNVTIGSSDLAGTSAKLYVDGRTYSKTGFLFEENYGIWKGGQWTGSLATTDILYNATKHIFNNGNVLIGTTTDAGYKLYVNGTARIADAVKFAHTLSVEGAVTMSSTLSVAGATTINGALTAGATTINGNLIVKGDVASA